jgi:hypothetical protein
MLCVVSLSIVFLSLHVLISDTCTDRELATPALKCMRMDLIALGYIEQAALLS